MVFTGIDIESVERFKGFLSNERFLRRVFTEREILDSRSVKNPHRRLAEKFTAKEACMKALATGLARGVRWKDIEVVVLDGGRPGLDFRGKALELLGPGRKAVLSSSSTEDLAVSLVIIEEAPLSFSPRKN